MVSTGHPPSAQWSGREQRVSDLYKKLTLVPANDLETVTRDWVKEGQDPQEVRDALSRQLQWRPEARRCWVRQQALQEAIQTVEEGSWPAAQNGGGVS